jgi:hypothetical protein
MATLTMGVDLAAQADDTAVCVLRWGDGNPKVISLIRSKDEFGAPLDDKWIWTRAANLREEDFGATISKVGIDDPFGWPEPFLDAMAAYRSGPYWPYDIEESTEELRLRHTDQVVRERSKGHSKRAPLSVTSNLIAVPAMRCAGLLTKIGRHRGVQDVRRDGKGLCCEVYPDPALREWVAGTSAALARNSYKKADNSATRVKLLGALREQLPLDDPNGLLEKVSKKDDYLDAFICALVARAAEVGLTYLPTSGEEARLALVEGWIHLPVGPLAELIEAVPPAREEKAAEGSSVVDHAPRADAPRTNRDDSELARKNAALGAPHIASLIEFVDRLRRQHPGALIPYFDPTEAGVNASILCLYEAPGPKSAPPAGSGFVSTDNNDQTATNMWHLLKEAGIDRSTDYVAWNVVPWYVGDGQKIRPVVSADLAEAKAATEELLALLPKLTTVILFGRSAARAWQSIGLLDAIEAPHPSPSNVNTRPEARRKILAALVKAKAAAN